MKIIPPIWYHKDTGEIRNANKEVIAKCHIMETGEEIAAALNSHADLMKACNFVLIDTNGLNATARAVDMEYAISPLCKSVSAAVKKCAEALCKANYE